MVVREWCKCSTCEQTHTLRISIGYNPYQEHTFHCVGCGEEIVVGMNVNLQEVSTAIQCVDNCQPGAGDGPVVNLNPHFTIPQDQLHHDRVFPWVVDSMQVHQIQTKLGAQPLKFSSLEERKKYVLSIQTPPKGWKIISKAWSLTQNERKDLAKTHLMRYKDPTFEGPQELNHILFHFCWNLTKPKNWLIYLEANNLAAEIYHKFLPEYDRFQDYYFSNLHSEHLQRYLDVFSQYFQVYSEFNQTLIFAQYGLSLPEESQASSRGFNKVKMFYGNAFEALTSNFTVLACLNNILNGRTYDQFDTMNLSKYLLTIDKAKRGNPFKDTEPFFEFARDFDSVLRNASHHGAIKIDRNSQVISYRSGGTGVLHTMTYAEYLYKCNEIFLRLAALLLLELTISSIQKHTDDV